MRSDSDIRTDVIAELRWVPDVDETNIFVEVTGAIVTLSGYVPDHVDRFHAETAARRVRGVTGVVNEIRISSDASLRRADQAIARLAIDAIRADLPAVADDVQVIVSDGHVTLEGTVPWHWQRQRIESAVRAIEGVTVVSNVITITPQAAPAEIKRRIEEAFLRSAEVDAARLSVEAHGGVITLRGSVSSLHEKDEAQRTAWSAPGVTQVNNEITVTG
jgi:osmotically-inducible protein OsmY